MRTLLIPLLFALLAWAPLSHAQQSESAPRTSAPLKSKTPTKGVTIGGPAALTPSISYVNPNCPTCGTVLNSVACSGGRAWNGSACYCASGTWNGSICEAPTGPTGPPAPTAIMTREVQWCIQCGWDSSPNPSDSTLWLPLYCTAFQQFGYMTNDPLQVETLLVSGNYTDTRYSCN